MTGSPLSSGYRAIFIDIPNLHIFIQAPWLRTWEVQRHQCLFSFRTSPHSRSYRNRPWTLSTLGLLLIRKMETRIVLWQSQSTRLVSALTSRSLRYLRTQISISPQFLHWKNHFLLSTKTHYRFFVLGCRHFRSLHDVDAALWYASTKTPGCGWKSPLGVSLDIGGTGGRELNLGCIWGGGMICLIGRMGRSPEYQLEMELTGLGRMVSPMLM